MAEDKEIVPQGYKENPDLLPTPKSGRTYNWITFTFMMFSMNTCIPMFLLGPIAYWNGLDIYQAIAGALIGNGAACLAMWLNGIPGVKYGIPYPVQVRESWGFRGSHVPVILRGVAGTMWFGIEAYAGSTALLMLIFYLMGTSVENTTIVAAQYAAVALLFYLGSFVVVMRLGLKGIGKMADWAGPLMLIYFVWLIYFLATSPALGPNLPKIYVSSVGWFSLGFLGYLAVQTNWWATVALNISDLSRGINPQKKNVLSIGLFVGVVFAQIIGTVLGYLPVVLTGEYLPQIIILKYAPGAIPILIGLMFAFLAPWSTDITANSPALIDILMHSFKLRWKQAVLGSAIICFFISPWWQNWLYASMGWTWSQIAVGTPYFDLVNAWALNYGILLGPIAGIMIGSYWVIRKQTYDVQKLYTSGPNGNWYAGGFSKAAFLSLLATWIICYIIAYLMPGQMTYAGPVPFPGGITWYPALAFSFIFYVLFARMFKE